MFKESTHFLIHFPEFKQAKYIAKAKCDVPATKSNFIFMKDKYFSLE
jgi:hypothetical protein